MRKLIIVLCLLLLAFTAIAHAENSVSVLCFHTFWGLPKYIYDFSREEFGAILDQFTAAGFKYVTMDDIFAGDIQGTKNILVTIDDGNKSVYEAFQLVLFPRSIKPLLALIGGSIQNISQDLTWDQVEELQASGCYIAAHGWFHLLADEKLKAVAPELFDQELIKSRKMLERRLSQPVVVYVYPYGMYIEKDKIAIPEQGYLLAFGLGQKPVTIPLTLNSNLYNLPRYIFDRKNYQSLIDLIIKEAK